MRSRIGIELERKVVGVQPMGIVRHQHPQRVLADDAGQFFRPGFGKVGGDVHSREVLETA